MRTLVQPAPFKRRLRPGAGGRKSAQALAALVLSAALLLSGSLPAWAQAPGQPANPRSAPPAPGVVSASGILVDQQSGKVLWAKDDQAVRAPASLTKILTALVVLEKGRLDSPVTITPEARGVGGSRTYAEAGWKFSTRDLLYGMLLKSGNDAATALAQAISPDGTVGGFMTLANRRAAEMGATSTHFTNPHGLDEPRHMSSARDMALITLKALQNPTFAQMVATRRHRVAWPDGSARTFINHNKMLAGYPGTVGVKTGFTNRARHSLSSAVSRNGSTLVAVTLGSNNTYADAMALYDWGFANLPALRDNAARTLRPLDNPPVAKPAPEAGVDLIGQALRTLQGIGSSSMPATTPAPALAVATCTFAALLSLFKMGLRPVQLIRRRSRVDELPREMEALAEFRYTGR